MRKDRNFFFIAQTGRMSFKPTVGPCNFYEYCLPARFWNTVKQAIKISEVGPGGLTYGGEFLMWLEEVERAEDEA